jgi:hypothetical protein
MRIWRLRGAAALVVALALSLAGAATATADSSDSSNWAGYAVHRSGVHFTKVLGAWTQPHASCTSGSASYSSVWVGIGGFSASSSALEQIGTELDCGSNGRAASSVWYELVPSPSHTTKLIVHQGDRMQASVDVSGHEVTLRIDNLTRDRTFTKRVRVTVVDTTSAEWIVEAPSLCSSASSCRTLPLADFGATAITGARATTTSGHAGSIVDRRWTTSKITLAESGHGFVSGSDAGAVLAQPSVLSAANSAFTVTYSGGGSTTTGPSPALASSAGVFHPGR